MVMVTYPTEPVARAKFELNKFDRVARETGQQLIAEVERLRELVAQLEGKRES